MLRSYSISRLGNEKTCFAFILSKLKMVSGVIVLPLVHQDHHGRQDQDFVYRVVARTPLRRIVESKEVSPLVAFLCLIKGAAYITDQVISVDGGMNVNGKVCGGDLLIVGGLFETRAGFHGWSRDIMV